jgi:glycosyltransferase involved in cell wall biosynthesis
MKQINIRLGIQQRVLPAYRVPFFDAFAGECPKGLGIFVGLPRRKEGIEGNVVPRNAAYFQANNIHLFNGPFYLCWQGGFLDWLKKWKPGALIIEANPRYLSSYLAIRWMKQHGLPVIGWGLGSSARPGILSGLRRILRKRFISQFAALIAYSKRGAQEYKRLGYPAQRIFIAPNAAVSRPIIDPPQRTNEYFNERPVVLFVGRLQARKKVDELIHACATLPETLRPVLHVVGDGPERSALESLSARIYPLTKFFGALHGRELDAQFSKADLFVLPGTGGLAIQQAMSFALPVIVGEADGTQEDLVCAINGWCLAGHGEDSLIKTLQTALSDVPSLRKKGMASYRIVTEEINLENMVSVFVSVVNSCLEKP